MSHPCPSASHGYSTPPLFIIRFHNILFSILEPSVGLVKWFIFTYYFVTFEEFSTRYLFRDHEQILGYSGKFKITYSKFSSDLDSLHPCVWARFFRIMALNKLAQIWTQVWKWNSLHEVLILTRRVHHYISPKKSKIIILVQRVNINKSYISLP